jgi:hypothetical protein
MENHLEPAFADAEIEIARGIREKRERSTTSSTPWDEPNGGDQPPARHLGTSRTRPATQSLLKRPVEVRNSRHFHVGAPLVVLESLPQSQLLAYLGEFFLNG